MFTQGVNIMQESHGARRAPWLTFGSGLFVILLYVLGPAMFNFLVFDKQLIVRGELWRLFTGHLVHCSLDHLAWDLLAFIILGSIIELNSRNDLLPACGLISLCITLWLLTSNAVTMYCGLSGALNGLLVIAAFLEWKKNHQLYCWAVVAGTIAKIAYEFSLGKTLFAQTSAQVVPGVHAVGLIAGIVFLLLTKGDPWGGWKSVGLLTQHVNDFDGKQW